MPPTKEKESAIDVALIKAVSHPDRLEALKILNERVASPTELALALDCPVNYIAYHVRVLAKHDCVELVKTEPRRGATEHFYRATKRPHMASDEWLLIPQSLREQLLEQSLRGMGADVGASIGAGKFEQRENRHFTYLPVDVDEQGWLEATELMDETLERFYDILAASSERRAESGEPAVPIGIAMLGFERSRQ